MLGSSQKFGKGKLSKLAVKLRATQFEISGDKRQQSKEDKLVQKM